LLNKQRLDSNHYPVGKENISLIGFVAGTIICLISYSANDDWIIDIGVNDHIIPYYSLLYSADKITQPCCITMPNGKHAQVAHVGSTKLGPKIELHNVLNVPEFQFNLLSAHKLTKQLTSNVIFTPNACLL